MPLDIATIHVAPADEQTVLLRLAGPAPGGAGALALRVGGRRFTALEEGANGSDDQWHAAFAVPKELLERADGPLTVENGDAVATLPRILPGAKVRPLPGAPDRSERAPGDASGQAADAHILVVDDDELIRMTVAATLEAEGYAVITAGDGAEALRHLDDALPDLIVSDVMMPDVDGLSLVARVRENPRTQRIPLIFLTSKRASGDVVAGLELGADDYLAKPFRPEELAARVRAKLARRPVPAEMLRYDPRTGVLAAQVLRDELAREIERAARGGAPGAFALVELDELPAVRSRLGDRAEDTIARRLAALVADEEHPLDVLGRLDRGRFGLLLPETGERAAQERLDEICRRVVRARFEVAGERLDFTPTIGFSSYRGDADAATVEHDAADALASAASHLEVRATAFTPDMALAQAAAAATRPARAAALRERLATPVQILATQVLGLVLPFFAYWVLDSIGVDITWPVYVGVVAALLVTATMIWSEGLLALRREDPPDEPGAPYPKATAVIAAYLPNEAATIAETVESFLAQDYPGELQVVLAYNTPHDLPIEQELRATAERDPRFVPFRVAHSTSKAQNVNAALATADGEMVAVFDADHQPAPGAFARAWRWLSNGYDLVQGHCVVRNGDVSWVSRTVAVEFESIYAVSHPGRARLHGFGIFGGTNGFWRAGVLREIRMRGSMLTEDIDSSMRVLEEGGRIASDPQLISRELGPATLRALWNQRMRWAQGWFQVSMAHVWRGLRSPRLRPRQKLGLFYLLGWREIYPWISVQMFPILAYWILRRDDVDWLVPLFVATTIFTLGIGPGQVLFAYRQAAAEIKPHKRWFAWYLVVSSLFYTEFKNVIARVAQIKELTGERHWKVTPRD